LAIYDTTVVRRTVAPAVRTNGTVNGAAVNVGAYGAESAIVAINTGTITDGSHAVSIQDSDDGAAGWANVAAGQLTGAPPTITAANSNTLFEIGVQPAKAYLRVVIVTTGATTGGAISATVVVGEPGTTPVSHA
jgi:hypothetical protein